MAIYALINDAIMRQIGSKLKELRIIKGIKQTELSEAFDISVFKICVVKKDVCCAYHSICSVPFRQIYGSV